MRVAGAFVALVLLVSGARAQIIEGSFEGGSPNGAAPAPWATSGTSNVYPGGSCFFEASWPTDGSQWCRLLGGGGASTPGNPSSYRSNATSLSQTFTIGSGSSLLTLDVAFRTAESAGSSTFNDFCVVEVEQGGTYATLLTLTTAGSSFPQTSVCGTDPLTDVNAVSADLFSLFPGSTTTTSFTLWIFCANGGDGAVASSVYVDKVSSGGAPPVLPFDVLFNDLGSGNWTLTAGGATFPNTNVRIFIALSQATPTGSGPFFGIPFTAEVVDQAFLPAGAVPFNVFTDSMGAYSFGPFFIPPGTGLFNLNYVAIALQGGGIGAISPAKAVSL